MHNILMKILPDQCCHYERQHKLHVENSTNIHEYSTTDNNLSTISVAIVTISPALNALVPPLYLCSRSTREKPSSVSMTFSQLATTSVVIPLQLVFHVISLTFARNLFKRDRNSIPNNLCICIPMHVSC